MLWMNVLCTSDQLSYRDLLLVEDGKLIPSVCILVNIPNSEKSAAALCATSQCLQVPGRKAV